MCCVGDNYIIHSTSLDSTFVLFDSTQVLSVVNESDEELGDQMLSDDFGGVRNEGESLAEQWFVDADEEEFAEISNELV